jgi:hypothetical protein
LHNSINNAIKQGKYDFIYAKKKGSMASDCLKSQVLFEDCMRWLRIIFTGKGQSEKLIV